MRITEIFGMGFYARDNGHGGRHGHHGHHRGGHHRGGYGGYHRGGYGGYHRHHRHCGHGYGYRG